MTNLPVVNIASREFKKDPYPFYARLRAEAPVYATKLPDKRIAWLITRYADIAMVLKDNQRFVNNRRNAMSPEQRARVSWIPPMVGLLEHNLLSSDSADHTRLRGLAHKAFTPHLIEQMRGRIETVAHELLYAAERRGNVDLIRDFALPLPLTIISEILKEQMPASLPATSFCVVKPQLTELPRIVSELFL